MSQYPPTSVAPPPTPPAAPPPSRGRRPVVLALVAGGLVVLLIASVVGVVVDRRSQHRVGRAAVTTPTTAAPATSPPTTGGTTVPSTTAPSAAPPAPGTVEAFVPEAERFVEQHRGLRFKQPVQVTVLDDNAFRQRLLADQQPDKADIDKATTVLEGLGLVPPGTDVAKAENALLGDAVAGFYDPKTKALVVRGEKPTPYVRQVIVHELTHAVQDQWFGVDRPDLDKADDERPDGFQALVEGDAVRIDNEYRASLSTAEQRQAEAEEAGQGGSISASVPPVLIELLAFPYDVGPDFTRALVRAGGQARLDAAFAQPPTTTEQLLHPEKYLAGEGAKEVAAPPAGGAVVDTGVLGESGFDVFLEQAIADGTLTPAEVQAAAAGWGGDRYVAWKQGRQSCVRDRVVMDTARDTSELVNAFQRYTSRRKSVTFTTSSIGVVVTSCG